MSEQKQEKALPTRSTSDAYERFRELTKRLVSVPKKEIEKQAKKKAG